jgi:ribosomal protein L31E
MTRETVNLSRARVASRNSRAKRAVKILREKLENQEGEEVTISSEVNQEIWSRGASKPPAKITVDLQPTEKGLKAFSAEQPKTQSSSSSGSNDVDYEEIVEGTVSEVKETVEEKDINPEKILEAEKKKKDRKTLKQFLKDLI